MSVAFTAACSRTTAVPETCTGAVRTGERNTRRFAVTVVGFEIAVFSLMDGVSVHDWSTSDTFGVDGAP